MNADPHSYSWWMPSGLGLVAGTMVAIPLAAVVPLGRLILLPPWLHALFLVCILMVVIGAVAYTFATWHFKAAANERVLQADLRIARVLTVYSRSYALDSIQRIYREEGFEGSTFLYLLFVDGSKKCVASFKIDHIESHLRRVLEMARL